MSPKYFSLIAVFCCLVFTINYQPAACQDDNGIEESYEDGSVESSVEDPASLEKRGDLVVEVVEGAPSKNLRGAAQQRKLSNKRLAHGAAHATTPTAGNNNGEENKENLNKVMNKFLEKHKTSGIFRWGKRSSDDAIPAAQRRGAAFRYGRSTN